MSKKQAGTSPREHDFALIVSGAGKLTPHLEKVLYEAGCDDATLSIQYGWLYMEFSRQASSLKEAVISAINQVQDNGLGLKVMRVDECNLVTASDIARRMNRTRQLVHQYITGQRGPGNFPPPECHLAEHAPLWRWCAVSYWLVQNNMIRPEEAENAEVVEAINQILEFASQTPGYVTLLRQIGDELQMADCTPCQPAATQTVAGRGPIVRKTEIKGNRRGRSQRSS